MIYTKKKNKPKEPRSILELYLLEQLCRTLNGEQFGKIVKEGEDCIIFNI